MGMPSMIVMLAPTLEVDLGEVVMSSEDINLVLMGINITSGLQGIMELAEICFMGVRIKGCAHSE